jgi:hypothetical protein
MKNFTQRLFILTLGIVAATTAFSATIEQSFDLKAADAAWLPNYTVQTEDTACVSPTNLTWKLTNAKLYINDKYPGYLMLYSSSNGNKLAAGALTLPVANFKVGSITIGTGASASTAVNVTLYADGTAVETKTLNAKSADFTWALTGQKAGVVYKLVVANAKNAQITKVVINEAASSPTVAFKDANDLVFGTPLNGSQTDSTYVLGENLTDKTITVSLSGNNASSFTLKAGSATGASVTAESGALIEVTYKGTTTGTASAVLTIASSGATATQNLTATTVARQGTQTDPLTVEDVNTLNNANKGPFWVKGIIAGSATNVSEALPNGVAATAAASNLAISQEGVTVAVPVELKSATAFRTVLNLVDNAGNLNKELLVNGSLVSYFSRAGVKDLTDAYLDGVSVMGIKNVVDAPTVVSSHIYNIAGQKLGKLGRGVNVIQNKMSDGSTATKKVIKK